MGFVILLLCLLFFFLVCTTQYAKRTTKNMQTQSTPILYLCLWVYTFYDSTVFMGERIIAQAIKLVVEDTKLVRLAFITSFCHSLIMIALLLLNLNNMMVARFER